MKLSILILCSVVVICSVIVICHSLRLKDTLSNQEHFSKDGEHDHVPAYDHDAFLGKDVAKEYDKHTPEESKEKLGKLFHEVDEDSDDFVTIDELKKWINETQSRYVMHDSNTQMTEADVDKDGFVSWEEYRKNTYIGAEDDGLDDETKKLMASDERRFKVADEHGVPDMKLKIDEFAAFLHPESYDHMKESIFDEMFDDLDNNKDGSVSLNEYMSAFPEEVTDDKRPAWLESIQAMFRDDHDKNKDGRLDREEVRMWTMPDDDTGMEGGIANEAQHLLAESDINKDGKLSKQEMIDKYDVFVGSHFIGYGEIFKSDHTEL